jgi:hypothetical protein
MRCMHLWLSAMLLLLAGCTVQLVSPYNAEIANRTVAMYEDVSVFEEHMRTLGGTVAGDPRQPELQRLFDGWWGSLQTMRALSVSNAAGVIDCAAVARWVEDRARRVTPQGAQSVSTPSVSGAVASAQPLPEKQDCQTAVIEQTLAELRAVREQFNRVCRAAPEEGEALPPPTAKVTPAMQQRCRSMWVSSPGASPILSGGNLMEPLLRDLRWLLAIQEAKRTSTSASGT